MEMSKKYTEVSLIVFWYTVWLGGEGIIIIILITNIWDFSRTMYWIQLTIYNS